jgi:aldose 1-epimerase
VESADGRLRNNAARREPRAHKEYGMETGAFELHAAGVALAIDADRGGRIARLAVHGLELLHGDERCGPLGWGCFALAPWAGRLRDGCFRRGARSYWFSRNMPPHAIHGTVFGRAWERLGEDTIRCELGPDWPFGGHAQQRFELDPDGLTVRLEVQAGEQAFEASAGLHPWFRRQLARGAPARLLFDAGLRYECDADGIPTGALIEPGPGPWDDCFVGVVADPELCWEGALRLRISSSHAHWVVYDRPEHALCVEPWTAAPNALNGSAARVAPGRPLVLEMRLRWWPDG